MSGGSSAFQKSSSRLESDAAGSGESQLAIHLAVVLALNQIATPAEAVDGDLNPRDSGESRGLTTDASVVDLWSSSVC